MCHLIACVGGGFTVVDNTGPGWGCRGLWKTRGHGVCGKHEVLGPVGFCEKYRLQTEVRVKRMQGVE